MLFSIFGNADCLLNHVAINKSFFVFYDKRKDFCRYLHGECICCYKQKFFRVLWQERISADIFMEGSKQYKIFNPKLDCERQPFKHLQCPGNNKRTVKFLKAFLFSNIYHMINNEKQKEHCYHDMEH